MNLITVIIYTHPHPDDRHPDMIEVIIGSKSKIFGRLLLAKKRATKSAYFHY